MLCRFLHEWQSRPTTTLLLLAVCVFFFFGFFSVNDKFNYLAVVHKEAEIEDVQLVFDDWNASTTTTSLSAPSSAYVDPKIESNVTSINASTSSSLGGSTSTEAPAGTDKPTTNNASVPNNNSSSSNSIPQTTQNGKIEDNNRLSQPQKVQQQQQKQSSTINQTKSSTISKTNPPPHYFMEISLSHDDDNIQSLGESIPEYISTTLDWWSIGTEGWENSSVINADLLHPQLIAAASGLRPYILRIGGSQADEILYNMEPSLEGKNRRRNSSSNGTTTTIDDFDIKIANECRKHPQKCLTKDRWDTVLKFAQQTGARIVFTVAYVRHTRGENNGEDHTKNDVQDWDSRNARRFLEYTYTNKDGGTLFGFELGNELRHKNKISNITRVVNAYKELGSMVNEIWGENPKPKLLGPASTGVGETSYLLSQIGPHIQIASYHKYHGGGKNPDLPSYAQHPSFYPHPMKLSGPGEAVKKYVMPDGNSSKKAQLWIGEGAMAYDSGLHGLTDTFHGSLWYANILGALTKTKPLPHSVYCRQSLLGGYYELISHNTLMPNPDYWVAYLWKKLVGRKAIGPIISPQRKDSVKLSSYQTFGCCKQPGSDEILIHSFCAKSTTNTSSGDVVFIVINTSKSKAMYLSIPMSKNNRTEYILRPNEAAGLKSRQVFLNGQLLSIDANTTNDYVLPDIRELGVPRSRGEQFHIPPISIAFIVIHETEVEKCM